MEIKPLLLKSIEEKFKVSCVINQLEKEIKDLAKSKVLKKYKDHKFVYTNNLEFELFKVLTDFHVYNTEIPKVRVIIWFTATENNRLLKKQLERLKKYKSENQTREWFEQCPLREQLWEQYTWSLDLDYVLNTDMELSWK
jgi:hypothetical protein